MGIQVLLWPLISWVFRDIVIKFVLLTGLYAVIAILVPVAVGYVLPHISTVSLSTAFLTVSPGVWYFLDLFAISNGLPLVISAFVTRFLIRRLPFIG